MIYNKDGSIQNSQEILKSIDSQSKAYKIFKTAEQAREELITFSEFVTPFYIPNWHHRVMAYYLQRVESGEIKRLIFLQPPRHGKSTLTNINFTTWYLGRNPTYTYMLLSYSDSLPKEFGQKARNIMVSPYYRLVFNVELDKSSTAKNRWQTTVGGGYMGMGREGSVTGKGGDILAVDDMIKNNKEADSLIVRNSTWDLWLSSARTRLNSDGAIVICMTRWHDDDIIGRIFKQDYFDERIKEDSTLTPGNWTVVNMPAIAEDDESWVDGIYTRAKGEALYESKYPLDTLLQTKRDMTERWWYTMYQQNPSHESGALVTRDLWGVYDKDDIDPKNIIKKVISYDTADTTGEKSNYTAMTAWVQLKGVNRPIALTNSRKRKVEFLGLVDMIKHDYISEQPNTILVEEKGNGRALLQTFKQPTIIGGRNVRLPVESFNDWCKRSKIPSNLGKQERVDMCLPHIQNKEVLLPNRDSDWKSQFLKEWLSMDLGVMDTIDSSTQCIIYLKGRRKVELW